MGYTGGSSSFGNVTKEVKFVKAKDLVVVDLNEEKLKMEEKKDVVNQRMLNPRNQSVGTSESRAKSRPQPQRGPRATYVRHYCGL